MGDDAVRSRLIDLLMIFGDAELKSSDVSDSSLLADDLAFSSLMTVELVCDLEDEFAITVEPEDFEQGTFETVGDILSLLEEKLSGL